MPTSYLYLLPVHGAQPPCSACILHVGAHIHTGSVCKIHILHFSKARTLCVECMLMVEGGRVLQCRPLLCQDFQSVHAEAAGLVGLILTPNCITLCNL